MAAYLSIIAYSIVPSDLKPERPTLVIYQVKMEDQCQNY